MEKIFEKPDVNVVKKFEDSVKEILSIYLIDSANQQGLIDDNVKSYLIHNI